MSEVNGIRSPLVQGGLEIPVEVDVYREVEGRTGFENFKEKNRSELSSWGDRALSG